MVSHLSETIFGPADIVKGCCIIPQDDPVSMSVMEKDSLVWMLFSCGYGFK